MQLFTSCVFVHVLYLQRSLVCKLDIQLAASERDFVSERALEDKHAVIVRIVDGLCLTMKMLHHALAMQLTRRDLRFVIFFDQCSVCDLFAMLECIQTYATIMCFAIVYWYLVYFGLEGHV
jgi:hypothetical protein